MTPGEEFLQRELAPRYPHNFKRYEVTFVVRDKDDRIDHKWSAAWYARDFGHAEQIACEQLAVNKDTDSVVERIELW